MTQFKKICATFMLALTTTCTVFAGGILTNTNQSIDFLRNPARDGAIGIDGVYANPAGVAFLSDGFHLGFNWQAAFQTRTVETTNQLFAMGATNNGATTKTFKGNAKAPFLPSLHAAYVHKKWSFQFGFGVIGGGGKCEFPDGLGSFESAVGGIGYQLNQAASQLQQLGINAPGVKGYDANYYMRGNQFYYGFTLGATYRPIKNLSIYLGARALYGTASYKASISDIKVISTDQNYTLPDYLNAVSTSFKNGQATAAAYLTAAYMQAGLPQDQAYTKAVEKLTEIGQNLTSSAEKLAPYYNGVNLQCDQTAFGVAPIVGVDYKVGNFNFAAKYEFKTHMNLKNSSTLKEAMALDAVNQFKDGEKVHEDMPALLTVGAQWQIIPMVRVNAGYHHYFDKQAKKYNDKQKLLSHGTNEYLGGVEVEPIKKLTVSAGFQITNYGLTDEYMSDLSFVTNSWSFGFGGKYQFNKHIAAQVAYFQTNYGHYKQEVADSNGNINDFTRTNRVIGAGVEVTF